MNNPKEPSSSHCQTSQNQKKVMHNQFIIFTNKEFTEIKSRTLPNPFHPGVSAYEVFEDAKKYANDLNIRVGFFMEIWPESMPTDYFSSSYQIENTNEKFIPTKKGFADAVHKTKAYASATQKSVRLILNTPHGVQIPVVIAKPKINGTCDVEDLIINK